MQINTSTNYYGLTLTPERTPKLIRSFQLPQTVEESVNYAEFTLLDLRKIVSTFFSTKLFSALDDLNDALSKIKSAKDKIESPPPTPPGNPPDNKGESWGKLLKTLRKFVNALIDICKRIVLCVWDISKKAIVSAWQGFWNGVGNAFSKTFGCT